MRPLRAILLGLAAGGGFVPLALLGLAWYAARQVTRRRKPDALWNPADLGLEYEPVTFVSRDGLRLGGWFVPGAEPARGTVIFCHGHAGSLDPDLKYVPAFHNHHFSVLQFDFRAHGRSEGQCVSMGYNERLDLLGAVDWLQARAIERVGVLGFSMGGSVAISAAAQCPAIAAIISDGGFARIEPTLRAGMRDRGMPARLADILSPLIVEIAGWRVGCDLPAADPLRWIARISPRPVLLIHGGQDSYIPHGEIDRLYAAAGHPKELWLVTEAEHRQVDAVHPEEYIARVLGFFDQWLVQEGADA
jgi:alpha-beta hydrolase superfamily lysophospholipase